MHFSIAVFAGSPTEPEQRKRLLTALLVSLLLHLLAWRLLQPAAGTGAPGVPGSAAVQATLRAAAGSPLAPPAVAELPVRAAEPPSALREAEAARPAEASDALLATLGERRLAAHLPPYLATVLTVPQGAWYFSRAELTVPPQLLDEPVLQPPQDAAAAPATGRLVLRVFVGADGAVERVVVASSSLPPAFDEAAVAEFSRLRFRPGEIEGVPVTSEARFELAFQGSEYGGSHLTDRVRVR